MSNQFYQDPIFYHIYPLGLCDAPKINNIHAPVVHAIERLHPWLDHAQSLGMNALYLGPVFQSTSHGYDTIDYYQIDRRLGDRQSFARFAEAVHQRGMRLVLDGVFNHVGRDFWAFKDVIEKGENSNYRDWFYNLRFGKNSPVGDPFTYEGWHGHTSLVKLNLAHPHVRAHLFDAIGLWMDEFGIDGLRLDAADCIDFDFLRALSAFVKGRQEGFWLLGEVVHGDYRNWANPATLDSVTNYECYKGLFSSLNDGNYFEIAHTFERQFGVQGLYNDIRLYNFVDNHDVDRVASKLKYPEHLFPLYLLLFSMPGIPSVYYGSEWGIQGIKENGSDAALRPKLDLNHIASQAPQHGLVNFIRALGEIRLHSTALQSGDMNVIHVTHQQFAFLRQTKDEMVVVALNSAQKPVILDLQPSCIYEGSAFLDMFSPGELSTVQNGCLKVSIPPSRGRILKRIG